MKSRETQVLMATDEELVKRLDRGDQAAFAELLDRHSGTVYRYAWGLAEARDEVPEIVQETKRSARLSEDTATLWCYRGRILV
ncbi:hypothetical protein GCM10027403_26810 [Arthrobacter tecti]